MLFDFVDDEFVTWDYLTPQCIAIAMSGPHLHHLQAQAEYISTNNLHTERVPLARPNIFQTRFCARTEG